MIGLARSVLRAFARDVHGGASLELAFGSVALLSVAALCFDLYARIEATAASGRAAVSMADYVSRDAAPNGNEMVALGRFLHTHEIGVPSAMVYVVSAFHQPPGIPLPAVELVWSDDTIRVGPEAETAALASECARLVKDGNARLPSGFAMSQGESVVVAEVCVRLTREGSLTGAFVAGDIYRLHALPTRDSNAAPAEPVYAQGQGPSALASLGTARRGAAGPAAVTGAAARRSTGAGAPT